MHHNPKEDQMTKKELINQISKEANLTKKDAAIALDAVFDIIKDSVTEGDQIRIHGFGTFDVRQVAARKGFNPQTGETMTIPSHKRIVFKPSKTFKDSLK